MNRSNAWCRMYDARCKMQDERLKIGDIKWRLVEIIGDTILDEIGSEREKTFSRKKALTHDQVWNK